MAVVCCLLLLPYVEVSLLRGAFHAAFGRNNSSIGFHFSDVYLPLILGIAICLEHLHRNRVLPIQFCPWAAALNIALFVLVRSALFYFDHLWNWLGTEAATGTVLVLAFACVVSSFFILVNLRKALVSTRGHLSRLWLVAAGMGALFCYPYILHHLWPILIHPLGACLRWCLLGLGFAITRFELGQVIGIHHPLLRASVGMPCSGLLGIFFFFFAYFLYLFFSQVPTSWRRASVTMSIGVMMMFWLNVLRIVLFFAVAIGINKTFQLQYGRWFFVWAFHEHIGWLIYMAGLYYFFKLLSKSDQRLASAKIQSQTR